MSVPAVATPPGVTDFNNAAQDLQDLADILNGGASATVTNRNGDVIPSVQKVIADAAGRMGGYVVAADIAARNAIPSGNRFAGMRVYVRDRGDGQPQGYVLASNLSTWTASPEDLARVCDLTAWGGAGDWTGSAGTENYAKLSAQIAALGAGITVRLPFVQGATNVYQFSSSTWTALGQCTLDVDEGVQLQFANDGMLYSQPGISVRRPTRVRFASPAYAMTWRERNTVSSSDKAVWLSAADADRAVLKPVTVNSAEVQQLKVAWPSGDSFSSDSGATTSASALTFSGVANDGAWHLGMRNVVPGDELTINCESVSGNPTMTALVRGIGGYAGMYWDTQTNGSATQSFRKMQGVSAVTANVNWLGKGTHASYNGDRSVVTIRITGWTTFDVLCNGVLISQGTTQSIITQAGYGVYGASGVAVRFANWTLRRGADPCGIGMVQPLVIGDSKSASRVDDWVRYAVQALEGSLGARVLPPANYAIAGQSSAQQLSNLQTLGMPSTAIGVNLLWIDLPTNDIQAGTSVSTTMSNITAIVNYVLAANPACRVVIAMPELWYTQSQAGAGIGQASSNYDAGAPYRQAIARYCADNGYTLCDVPAAEGPILAQLLNATLSPNIPAGSVDPVVVDNIHPGSYAARLKGLCVARATLGACTVLPGKALGWQLLASSAYANSWTQSGSQPVRWRFDADGNVQLNGIVNAGTTTNGTTVAQLPQCLWPEYTVRAAAFAENGMAGIVVGTDGAVKVYNWPSGSSTLSVDALQYKPANGIA